MAASASDVGGAGAGGSGVGGSGGGGGGGRGRGRGRASGREDESLSDGSNVGTPASADTPLASSFSRGASFHAIRDPYAATPVRGCRRNLVASTSLTADR